MFYLLVQTAFLLLIALLLGAFIVWWFMVRGRRCEVCDRRQSSLSNRDEAVASAPPTDADTAKEEAPKPVAAVEVPASSNEAVALSISATADQADDLKKIYGVGPTLEKLLNSLGVYTFEQVANFTEVDVRQVDERLGAFRGRIVRDNWIASAKELASK